jgi:prophage maintenance system killer protein
MGLFLESNGYKMSFEVTKGYDFLLGVAAGRVSESEVENWIATHLTERKEK